MRVLKHCITNLCFKKKHILKYNIFFLVKSNIFAVRFLFRGLPGSAGPGRLFLKNARFVRGYHVFNINEGIDSSMLFQDLKRIVDEHTHVPVLSLGVIDLIPGASNTLTFRKL